MVWGSNPGWGEIFHTCPDQPWAHPACTMDTGSFPGVKSGQGVTPHPLLGPWSWKGRAIPLLPLRAIRPVQRLSACTGVRFTACTGVRFTFLLLHSIWEAWPRYMQKLYRPAVEVCMSFLKFHGITFKKYGWRGGNTICHWMHMKRTSLHPSLSNDSSISNLNHQRSHCHDTSQCSPQSHANHCASLLPLVQRGLEPNT